jgi:hypothetical protein
MKSKKKAKKKVIKASPAPVAPVAEEPVVETPVVEELEDEAPEDEEPVFNPKRPSEKQVAVGSHTYWQDGNLFGASGKFIKAEPRAATQAPKAKTAAPGTAKASALDKLAGGEAAARKENVAAEQAENEHG